MPPRETSTSLDALCRKLRLDAALVTSPINTQFLTRCLILTQRLLPDRMAVVVAGGGREAFVVCDIEERQAREESSIPDVRGYTEFVASPIATAASVLGEYGVRSGRVGIEGRHLVADRYRELRELLPDAELVSIDGDLARLRSVKSPAQVEFLRPAFLATDRAIAAGYEAARPGDSTRSIVSRMKTALVDGGADETAFAVIGAGGETLKGHPEADERPLEVGEPVRVDFGGSFHGYYTDLARSAFVGEAPRDARDAYRRLWASLEDLVTAVRPGVEARAVYAAGKAALGRSGLALAQAGGRWEMPHVGHGIGLEIHESPVLQPSESRALEPGMILCLELFYTDPGRYRLHVEDAVVVTGNGCEVLSRSRDWSEPPVLG